MSKLLKILNILGYFSLFNLLYYIVNFLLGFDLFLQILNGILVIILLSINFIFFKKKKYTGIRCCIIIVIMFVLSFATYNIYGIIRGNVFKNTINEICDQSKNVLLKTEDLSNYNARYIPDKVIIDMISKGGGQKGYIKFENSKDYNEII